ncbi:hypothetical protein BaRGS_00006383 [Batillaria attramentaria]|uniref:Uncharacterized protein n=1 Tax=Batillaria attramentaria TaxID=370345 RepID=A0ABD0LS62_9CAEN
MALLTQCRLVRAGFSFRPNLSSQRALYYLSSLPKCHAKHDEVGDKRFLWTRLGNKISDVDPSVHASFQEPVHQSSHFTRATQRPTGAPHEMAANISCHFKRKFLFVVNFEDIIMIRTASV